MGKIATIIFLVLAVFLSGCISDQDKIIGIWVNMKEPNNFYEFHKDGTVSVTAKLMGKEKVSFHGRWERVEKEFVADILMDGVSTKWSFKFTGNLLLVKGQWVGAEEELFEKRK